MIWLWRICSSGLVIAGYLYAQTVVKGKIVLDGAHTKQDFSNVAVWLDPVSHAGAVSHNPRKHSLMLQKDKRFTPHVLVIESGTVIDFPNRDPIFHNAFSNFDGQIFDIGLYPPGTSRAVAFNRPGVVRVFCNIHSTMSAVIVVVDSPYYTTSLKDGSFSISGVEPGEYVLRFFHERALPEELERLKRSLTVAAQPVEVEPVTISEAGYLPVLHKNKYGNDYPPDSPKYGSVSQ